MSPSTLGMRGLPGYTQRTAGVTLTNRNTQKSLTLPVTVTTTYLGRTGVRSGGLGVIDERVHAVSVTSSSKLDDRASDETIGAAYLSTTVKFYPNEAVTPTSALYALLLDAAWILPHLSFGNGSDTRPAPTSPRAWRDPEWLEQCDTPEEARQEWRSCLKTATNLGELLGARRLVQAAEFARDMATAPNTPTAATTTH